LDAILGTMAMSKAETLAMIADVARNSTVDNLCKVNARGKYVFDLDHAITSGHGHLIKRVVVDGNKLKLEPLDRWEAIKLMAHIHGLVLNKSVNVNFTADDIARMNPVQLEQLANGHRPDGY
jgi:hypothetical protein